MQHNKSISVLRFYNRGTAVQYSYAHTTIRHTETINPFDNLNLRRRYYICGAPPLQVSCAVRSRPFGSSCSPLVSRDSREDTGSGWRWIDISRWHSVVTGDIPSETHEQETSTFILAGDSCVRVMNRVPLLSPATGSPSYRRFRSKTASVFGWRFSIFRCLLFRAGPPRGERCI